VLKTKNDDIKRYEFKKQVYQLAQNRGWLLEETAKILIFVEGLMLLEPETGRQFYEEINQLPQKNELNMLMLGYANKGFRDFMDASNRHLYGMTMREMQLANKQAKKEAAIEIKKAQQEIKKATQDKQVLEEKTILLLHSLGKSLPETVELMELPIEAVQKVLLKHKLIQG
jgi:hypothetical protein